MVLSNIRSNAQKALPAERDYSIQGLEWGHLDSAFAIKYAHHFDRILAADCFWMPSQHLNIVCSMLHFLTLDPEGQVFVTAGFHTGRAKLASFFDVAEDEGLEVEDILEEDAEGLTRDWATSRDEGREDHTARNKWLVIARLKRREQ